MALCFDFDRLVETEGSSFPFLESSHTATECEKNERGTRKGWMEDSSGGMQDSSREMQDSSGGMRDSSGEMQDSSGGM